MAHGAYLLKRKHYYVILIVKINGLILTNFLSCI